MSSQRDLVFAIMRSTRTVFTTQSLMMMSGMDGMSLASLMHKLVRQGILLNPRRGIYAKSGYNREEMACSIFHPSYISMEYVLQRTGIVFQYDETITSISYLTRNIDIDDSTYSFRKIVYQLWAGMEGIVQQDNICIATPERAFLDMMHLSAGNCYFDNLRPLNRKLILQLLPHYHSMRLTERVKNLLQ